MDHLGDELCVQRRPWLAHYIIFAHALGGRLIAFWIIHPFIFVASNCYSFRRAVDLGELTRKVFLSLGTLWSLNEMSFIALSALLFLLFLAPGTTHFRWRAQAEKSTWAPTNLKRKHIDNIGTLGNIRTDFVTMCLCI